MDFIKNNYGYSTDSDKENEIKPNQSSEVASQKPLRQQVKTQLSNTDQVASISVLDATSSSLSSKQHKREQKKIEKAESRTSLLNQCKCKQSCVNVISSDARMQLNKLYWKNSYIGRKSLIREHVRAAPIKRRRKLTDRSPTKKRTFTYVMKNDDGTTHKVCKAFFLNSLGCSKNNV